VLALSISIIVKKNGKFPETEVGRNRNMRKLGIRCTKQEEMIRWRQNSSKFKIQDLKCKVQDSTCAGCCGDECEDE